MRTGRLIWGLALVVLGCVLLTSSLGWTDWGFALSLLQLWPLVLIVLGIHFLLGHAHQKIAAVLMTVVILGGVGLTWVAWSHDWRVAEAKHISGAPLDNLTGGHLSMNLGASQLDIAGADIDVVFEASLRTHRGADVEQTIEHGVAGIRVGESQGGWFVFPFSVGGGKDHLAFTLASRVPWFIELNGGAAEMNVDLTNVILAGADVQSGASSLKLKVGGNVIDGARVSLAGGVTSYDIQFPRTLHVIVTNESGLTSTSYDSAFQKQADGTLVYDGAGNTVLLDTHTGVSSLRITFY